MNEDSAACVALQATMYKSDTKYLSSLRQLKPHTYLLAFPFLKVACNNCNWHTDISIVVYKVVLINIVILKLSISNEHIYCY
jgi:hypothetical protein